MWINWVDLGPGSVCAGFLQLRMCRTLLQALQIVPIRKTSAISTKKLFQLEVPSPSVWLPWSCTLTEEQMVIYYLGSTSSKSVSFKSSAIFSWCFWVGWWEKTSSPLRRVKRFLFQARDVDQRHVHLVHFAASIFNPGKILCAPKLVVWVFFPALSACLIEDNAASYNPGCIWAAGTCELVKAEQLSHNIHSVRSLECWFLGTAYFRSHATVH